MDRQVRKSVIGTNRVRYRVVITGEPCQPPPTHEARIHQALFLEWLASNQTMLECGYHYFERLTIRHNGGCWEAVAEAEVDEEVAA